VSDSRTIRSPFLKSFPPAVVIPKMTRSLLNWFASDRSRRFGRTLVALTITVCGTASSAQAQNNTQRSATLGGIGGAIAGAIIGDNNNEAGAGAAIGGAIGVVAGGLLGNARDKDLRYQNQYYAQPRYTQQQQMPRTVYTQPIPTGAVSYSDVVAMSRSGVGESVILNQIATRGVQRQPVVSDIISLHQQGVSETVIGAMQQAPLGNQFASGSTIVETPVYVTPRVQAVPVYRGHHYSPVYRTRPNYHMHYGR